MRLPAGAHTSRPWRIHELTPDFELLDVWALPTPGDAEDFPRLIALLASFRPGGGSPVVRALFAIRFGIGRLLGWDSPDAGLDRRVPGLRERLPADLRGSAPLEQVGGFLPLYATADEYALELANGPSTACCT